MLERQKEKQTQLFNFFKFQKKKEPTAVKIGKYTYKTAFGVFKFFSYSFGALFFIGVTMTIINSPSREERLRFKQDMATNAIKLEAFYNQKAGKASYEMVDLVKSAKSSEETIKALNNKYKQNINFSYADKDMISFSYRIDYRPSSYVIKFDNKSTNVRLVNSSPQIFNEFEKLAKDRKDITWTQKTDNPFDKNLRSDYLSINIKG